MTDKATIQPKSKPEKTTISISGETSERLEIYFPAVLHALQILMLEIGRYSCAAPCIGISSGTATLNFYVHSPLLSFSLS